MEGVQDGNHGTHLAESVQRASATETHQAANRQTGTEVCAVENGTGTAHARIAVERKRTSAPHEGTQ